MGVPSFKKLAQEVARRRGVSFEGFIIPVGQLQELLNSTPEEARQVRDSIVRTVEQQDLGMKLETMRGSPQLFSTGWKNVVDQYNRNLPGYDPNGMPVPGQIEVHKTAADGKPWARRDASGKHVRKTDKNNVMFSQVTEDYDPANPTWIGMTPEGHPASYGISGSSEYGYRDPESGAWVNAGIGSPQLKTAPTRAGGKFDVGQIDPSAISTPAQRAQAAGGDVTHTQDPLWGLGVPTLMGAGMKALGKGPYKDKPDLPVTALTPSLKDALTKTVGPVPVGVGDVSRLLGGKAGDNRQVNPTWQIGQHAGSLASGIPGLGPVYDPQTGGIVRQSRPVQALNYALGRNPEENWTGSRFNPLTSLADVGVYGGALNLARKATGPGVRGTLGALARRVPMLGAEKLYALGMKPALRGAGFTATKPIVGEGVKGLLGRTVAQPGKESLARLALRYGGKLGRRQALKAGVGRTALRQAAGPTAAKAMGSSILGRVLIVYSVAEAGNWVKDAVVEGGMPSIKGAFTGGGVKTESVNKMLQAMSGEGLNLQTAMKPGAYAALLGVSKDFMNPTTGKIAKLNPVFSPIDSNGSIVPPGHRDHTGWGWKVTEGLPDTSTPEGRLMAWELMRHTGALDGIDMMMPGGTNFKKTMGALMQKTETARQEMIANADKQIKLQPGQGYLRSKGDQAAAVQGLLGGLGNVMSPKEAKTINKQFQKEKKILVPRWEKELSALKAKKSQSAGDLGNIKDLEARIKTYEPEAFAQEPRQGLSIRELTGLNLPGSLYRGLDEGKQGGKGKNVIRFNTEDLYNADKNPAFAEALQKINKKYGIDASGIYDFYNAPKGSADANAHNDLVQETTALTNEMIIKALESPNVKNKITQAVAQGKIPEALPESNLGGTELFKRLSAGQGSGEPGQKQRSFPGRELGVTTSFGVPGGGTFLPRGSAAPIPTQTKPAVDAQGRTVGNITPEYDPSGKTRTDVASDPAVIGGSTAPTWITAARGLGKGEKPMRHKDANSVLSVDWRQDPIGVMLRNSGKAGIGEALYDKKGERIDFENVSGNDLVRWEKEFNNTTGAGQPANLDAHRWRLYQASVGKIRRKPAVNEQGQTVKPAEWSDSSARGSEGVANLILNSRDMYANELNKQYPKEKYPQVWDKIQGAMNWYASPAAFKTIQPAAPPAGQTTTLRPPGTTGAIKTPKPPTQQAAAKPVVPKKPKLVAPKPTPKTVTSAQPVMSPAGMTGPKPMVQKMPVMQQAVQTPVPKGPNAPRKPGAGVIPKVNPRSLTVMV